MFCEFIVILIRSMDEATFMVMLVDILCVCPSLIIMWIQYILIMNNHQIKRLIDSLSTFEDPVLEPNDYATIDKSLYRSTKMLLKVLIMLLIIGTLVTLFENCEEEKVDDCGLITYSYPFFNVFYTPARQIYLMFQLFGSVISVFIIISIYIILYSMSQCIMSRLRHLALMLNGLKGCKSRKVKRLHLRNCVDYHRQIIQLSEDLNQAMLNIFLVFVSAPVVISMIIYQILVDNNHTFFQVIHIMLWFCTTTSASFNGEMYIQHSLAISDVAYDCIEFDGDIAFQKDLLLIILRSRYPLELKLGKYFILKNDFALSTLKLAYTVTAYLVKRLDI